MNIYLCDDCFYLYNEKPEICNQCQCSTFIMEKSYRDEYKVTIKEEQDIIDFVSRIKYKDWEFKYSKIDEKNFMVEIFTIVEDIHTKLPFILDSVEDFKFENFNQKDALQTIFNEVFFLELHEIKEHFKYDGFLVYNPHNGKSIDAKVKETKEQQKWLEEQLK